MPLVTSRLRHIKYTTAQLPKRVIGVNSKFQIDIETYVDAKEIKINTMKGKVFWFVCYLEIRVCFLYARASTELNDDTIQRYA